MSPDEDWASERELSVGAVVLAAGRGSRMGPTNKLLARVGGVAIVARVVDAALAAGAAPVLVVTGYDGHEVTAVLSDRSAVCVSNVRWAEGMGSSLALGLTALGEGVDGALVCLGDMPRMEAADLRALIDAFRSERGPDACVPVHEGRRGNPVLWSSRCFSALRSLQGDQGGKALLEERGMGVIEVPVPGRGVLFDVDTPEALDRAVRDFPVRSAG